MNAIVISLGSVAEVDIRPTGQATGSTQHHIPKDQTQRDHQLPSLTRMELELDPCI